MPEITIIRKSVFNPATQGWTDEIIPTDTVKRSGWGRDYAANDIIASHYVSPGSPATVEKVWMVQRARFHAGSPDTLFAVEHSRLGSVDTIYFESPGEQVDLLDTGVYKFPTGSVRVRMVYAGSTPLAGFGVSLEGVEL